MVKGPNGTRFCGINWEGYSMSLGFTYFLFFLNFIFSFIKDFYMIILLVKLTWLYSLDRPTVLKAGWKLTWKWYNWKILKYYIMYLKHNINPNICNQYSISFMVYCNILLYINDLIPLCARALYPKCIPLNQFFFLL